MAHSIEVLLDDRSDEVIRAQWQTLADADLPSQMRVKSPTNRPHITLLAAERISPEVDDDLRALADWLPVECVVGAALVFGGHSSTLARLIVPSARLLDLHAEVCRLTLPHITGEPFGHCMPGRWTPHATLGRRFTAEQIGPALAAVQEPDGGAADFGARIVGMRRWDSDQRVDQLLIG
ncbi:MAG: 2'-5' RNA ligase family protein [Mycobacterium sp.]